MRKENHGGKRQMKEKWVEIAVRVPVKFIEVLKKQLYDLGSAGSVEDSLAVKGVEEGRSTMVKGYFCGTLASTAGVARTVEEFISSLSAIFPSETFGKAEASETTEEDWQRWKDFFKPVAVSRRVVIKPSWEKYELKGEEVVVEIDPGMAFGTGTHETTRLCCVLLDRIIAGGERVLDVGTGTGILAITAAKLGAGRVFAIDVDERSVEISAENVRKNGVSEIVEISSARLEEVQEMYDIIIANILAEDLIAVRHDLAIRLEEKGRIILSGILRKKAEKVIAAYREEGMMFEEMLEEGEWTALQFIK